MTTIDSTHTPGAARTGTVPIEAGELPWCHGCGTDEFLIFEEYVPPRLPIGGGAILPASAGYSCSECGSFAAHTVPGDWSPPHWFWYS
ncbi:hypothetical protein ACX80W_06085 [Arthrobacter sp. TMN-37]